MNTYNGMISDIEEILADFLAYRMEKKRLASGVKPAEEEPGVPVFSELSEIGKGWPYYKNMSLPITDNAIKQSPSPPKAEYPPIFENDIVRQLDPVVATVIEQYGYPQTAHAHKQLTNHAIARAMTIAEVGHIMRAKEMSPWGRAQLLQTVIELLIVFNSRERRSYYLSASTSQ